MKTDFIELTGDGVDSVSITQANILCVLSTVFFYILAEILNKIGKPNFVASDAEFWRWRNILISWVHGVLCGVWDFLCVVWYPDCLRDPVAFINNFTYLMIPFSAGYFIYDFIDLMQNKRLSINWEITLHHTIIVTSFIYNWTAKTCVGYNVLALMAEMNTIFLHLRKLLQMCKFGFDSKIYQTITFFNLLTFITCRLIPQARLFSGFYFDSHRVSTTYLIFFGFTVTTGIIINIILFWRLVKTDILKGVLGWGLKKKGANSIVTNGNNNADYSKDE